MQKVLSLIEKSVATDASVLITGEAGVGKGLVAREIHRQSARGERRLLRIDCASLTDDFFDNDPVAAGASGDPHRAPWNRFRAVDGGTLFLDNIDELSSLLQEKLLRLLREQDSPWAGIERRQRVDFRLIAATHRGLTQLLDSGKLREDLCYLVNVIHIQVPPLRARREDIPDLLRHFIEVHAQDTGWRGELTDDVLARFHAHDWPGNIDELENAVRRLMILRDVSYVFEELEASSENDEPDERSAPPRAGPASSEVTALADTVDLKDLGRKASDVAERKAIFDMLVRSMGNKKEAAQRLGISYKALLYKIHDLGIESLRPGPGSVVPPVSMEAPAAGTGFATSRL